MGKEYCVYIMTNIRNTVLYTGVTDNLKRRVFEHKTSAGGAFTKRYTVVKLIYFEVGDDVSKAIFREKQTRSWNRRRKKNSSTPSILDGMICTMRYEVTLARARNDFGVHCIQSKQSGFTNSG